MNRFHSLTVRDVRRETADAVSIAFDVPEDVRERFSFEPGQYLTLRAEMNGEEIRRSYSICSALGDGEVRVAVKQVDGGVFSTFANQNLQAGSSLEVMEPEGRFKTAVQGEVSRTVLALAAGSGITPILSIVKSILEGESDSQVTLIYGNRDTASILFREALEDLKDRFLSRFQLYNVLSRESQDIELLHGRVGPDTLKTFVDRKLIDLSSIDNVFICGPGSMSEELMATLQEIGVAEEKLHREVFTPDGSPPPVASARAQKAAEEGVRIAVQIDGSMRSFTMGAEDASVIEASERAGIDLPYSCKGGMCCTCRCKVLEGEAEMAVNYSLQPWELEAGFILSCQARPLTETLTLDFDAV